MKNRAKITVGTEFGNSTSKASSMGTAAGAEEASGNSSQSEMVIKPSSAGNSRQETPTTAGFPHPPSPLATDLDPLLLKQKRQSLFPQPLLDRRRDGDSTVSNSVESIGIHQNERHSTTDSATGSLYNNYTENSDEDDKRAELAMLLGRLRYHCSLGEQQQTPQNSGTDSRSSSGSSSKDMDSLDNNTSLMRQSSLASSQQLMFADDLLDLADLISSQPAIVKQRILSSAKQKATLVKLFEYTVAMDVSMKSAISRPFVLAMSMLLDSLVHHSKRSTVNAMLPMGISRCVFHLLHLLEAVNSSETLNEKHRDHAATERLFQCLIKLSQYDHNVPLHSRLSKSTDLIMRHALGAAEGFTSKQHLKNLLKEGLHLLRILAKNGQNARSVWHDLSLQQFFTMQYFVVEDAELRPIIFKLLSALFKETASPAADKDRDSWLALLLQSIGSGECLWEQLEMDLRLLQCLLNADQDSIIREFRQLNGYEKLCSAIERLRTPPTSPINNQHTAKAQQQKLIPMIMAIIQDSKICQQLLPFIDEQMPRKDFYSAALQTQLEQLTIADDLKGEMDETQLTEADKQLLDGFCAEITGVTAVKNNTENNEGVKSLKKFKFDDCDNNRFEFPPTEPQQILMRSMDSALAIAAEFITVKLPPQKNDEVQSLLVYDAYTETDMELPPGTLRFESRFESGNLLKAFRLGHTNEYNLILEPDYSVRNPHQLHAQWFYFSIKNAVTGTSYKFNILNIGKYDGSFNQGMQPVIFHASSSADWQRNGSEIYLFKNTYYQHSPRPEEHSPLGTLTFTLDSMPNNCTANQPIYIATHFPYTLSYLQSYLNQLTVETAPSSPFIRRQLLCKTMIGNRCDLLTITDFTATDSVPPMQSRPIVLLTARVHPSESNSSYMMHGLLQFLTDATDKQAIELRRRYIFKIVPMLNPDGVVCGFHRHSLSGDDLNRQWTRPSRTRHPTVYWTKRLVDYLVNCCGKTVLLSCDFHGHSRKNNVFIYACPPPAAGEIKLESNTDNNNDKTKVNSVLEKIFPRLWQTNGGEWNAFDYHSCTFALEKSKEGTQRITFRKQFGIRCSYTCESSFNGSLFNGKCLQFTRFMLTQQGRYFGETLNRFSLLLDHVASGASLDSIAGECAVPWLMEMINDNNIGAEIKSAAAIVGEKKSPKKKTIKKKRAANTKVKIKPIVDPASTAAEDEDYLEEDEQTTEAARSTDAERNWVHYVFH